MLNSDDKSKERSKYLQKEITSVNAKLVKLDDECKALNVLVGEKMVACQRNDSEVKELDKSPDQSQAGMRNTGITTAKSSSTSDVLKCRDCGDAFSSFRELRCHMTSMHKIKSECQQCNKKFPTSIQLERHMQEHGIEKKYSCEECDKTFHFKR